MIVIGPNVYCSYILMVPFDTEDLHGVVYVWVGSKADHDDASLTEEIAYFMYKVRKWEDPNSW